MTQEKLIQKRVIAILVVPNLSLMNVAGPADVFSRASATIIEQSATEDQAYEIVLLSPDESKRVTFSSGISMEVPHSIGSYKGPIDTLLISGSPRQYKPGKELIAWIQQTAKVVRRIGSVCRGAFMLAEAGLLNNRRANTHWGYCSQLQDCYPDVLVDSGPMFVKDGNIYTSGGVSSGADLALALVEEDYGAELALSVARQLVLFLRRPGNQLQFALSEPVVQSDHESINIAINWIKAHLNEDLTVELLADKCAMSPRNFARVFLKETGITPGKLIEKLRLAEARRQLEITRLPLEVVAERCGLGSSDSMRRIFLRNLKTTPSQYRNSFRTAP